MTYVHDNSKNGLNPKAWGKYNWKEIHFTTFGYPINPSDEDKEHYRNYFLYKGYTLPCEFCRKSYQEFVTSDPTNINNYLVDRDSLTKWGYLLHERVNEKLGITYGLSYTDFVQLYEKARIKCLPQFKECITNPIDKYEACLAIDKSYCVIIPIELVQKFKQYAEERGLRDFDNLEYYHKLTQNHPDDKRNKECHDIITRMVENNILSTEKTGIYKGLPTIDELKLISKLSSNLSVEQLKKIADKIKYENHFELTTQKK